MENVHFCCFYCLLNFTSLLSVNPIKPISKPVQFIKYIFNLNVKYHLLTYRQCIFYFETKKEKKRMKEKIYTNRTSCEGHTRGTCCLLVTLSKRFQKSERASRELRLRGRWKGFQNVKWTLVLALRIVVRGRTNDAQWCSGNNWPEKLGR